VVSALTTVIVIAVTHACGAEQPISHGKVFAVRAERVTCTTALQVAGRWYRFHRPRGSQTVLGERHTVRDAGGHAWSCRIVEHVAGAHPTTTARCERSGAVVRLRMRA
jgi:hypothetical protein